MPYKILVVDDNHLNLILLRKILEMEGYQVLTSQDSTEVIKIAEENPPDLAILDVMMPKLNGYDLCRQFRESLICKNVPVVILTAMSSENERKQAFDAGADDVWTKPFDMSIFRQQIQRLINKRQIEPL